MSMPNILTALPKRRYQYGEFSLVVLGDLESRDEIAYRFLLGIVPEGKNKPELFISAEKVGGADGEGAYRMRLIAEQVSQVVGRSDAWGDLESFSQDALALTAQLLDLPDEEPRRLL